MNRETSGSKPFTKGLSFSFTLNNPPGAVEGFADIFTTEGKKLIEYAIWQLEQGKESKTPHLQGHVSIIKGNDQLRIKAAKALFKEEFGKQVWLGAIKKNELASIRYASKQDETFVAGPWSIGKQPERLTETKQQKRGNQNGELAGRMLDDIKHLWRTRDRYGRGRTDLGTQEDWEEELMKSIESLITMRQREVGAIASSGPP